MRACLLATGVARRLRLTEAQLADTYYATLLRFVGCTATSTLLANGFAGNDVEIRRLGDLTDFSVPREALGFLWTVYRRAGAARPLRMAAILPRVPHLARAGAAADCEVGARLVARFGFANTLEKALLHAFERWDGHGVPNGLSGNSILLPSRLAALGFAAIMFEALGGRSAAVAVVRRWRGRAPDPGLCDVFLEASDELLECAARRMPGKLWWPASQVRRACCLRRTWMPSRRDSPTWPT